MIHNSYMYKLDITLYSTHMSCYLTVHLWNKMPIPKPHVRCE